MIIAQLSITPIGDGTSVSRYVKIALQSLSEDKVRYEVNAMSTVIQTENIEQLFEIVKKAHRKVLDAGAKRIITELKIDDRVDKNATIDTKLEALK